MAIWKLNNRAIEALINNLIQTHNGKNSHHSHH